METQELNLSIAVIQPSQELPKKRAKPLTHKPNGDFAKGNSGGPGRPRTAVISQAFREMLERNGAAKYTAAIENIALKGKRAADRIAAVNMIADRTEGKPVQAMLVGHTIDENSVRVIAEMLNKLTVQAALPDSEE